MNRAHVSKKGKVGNGQIELFLLRHDIEWILHLMKQCKRSIVTMKSTAFTGFNTHVAMCWQYLEVRRQYAKDPIVDGAISVNCIASKDG
jgi:hypothetical protein